MTVHFFKKLYIKIGTGIYVNQNSDAWRNLTSFAIVYHSQKQLGLGPKISIFGNIFTAGRQLKNVDGGTGIGAETNTGNSDDNKIQLHGCGVLIPTFFR